MSAEQIGRFKPGENLPVFASELLPAGRLVIIGADKTAQGDYSAKLAGANATRGTVLGATQRESGPTTDAATAWTRRVEIQTGGVVRVKASAAITAGEEVQVSGSGEVKKWAAEKNSVGVALNTVAENGYVEVLLK
jgi:hypothetical protein